MAEVTLKLTLEKRRWVDGAMEVLAVSCAVMSFISSACAELLSRAGVGMIVRFGFAVKAE